MAHLLLIQARRSGPEYSAVWDVGLWEGECPYFQLAQVLTPPISIQRQSENNKQQWPGYFCFSQANNPVISVFVVFFLFLK